MQPDTTQQFHRSKKYDTYVSGDTSARQNILPNTGQAPYQNQPVSYQPEPIAQPSYYPTTPYQNPVTTPTLHTTSFNPPKNSKKRSKKSTLAAKPAISAIMRATVQLEKVTKNSISVVKQTFEPDEINAIRTKKQKLFVRSAYAVGTASFLLLIGFGSRFVLGSRSTPQQKDVLGVQTNGTRKVSNEPTEQKPTDQDIKTYLVAPKYPRYIRIPKLGLEARVRRLGIDSKGAVAFPTNIYDIGWYDGSVKPGDNEGSSVLIGHLMGATQHGALWDIDILRAGDSIEIERGDGTVIKYRITKLYKAEPEDDLSTFLTPEINGKHDIKILTANGMYDKVSGDAQQRTVVYATEI